MGSRTTGGARRVSGELIDAWVDLAGLYAGNYTLPVQVELGPELVVDGIEPTAIEIEIR